MFQFLTHVELSSSVAAILEMPQYVAYQKNIALLCLHSLPNLTLLTELHNNAIFMALAALVYRKVKIGRSLFRLQIKVYKSKMHVSARLDRLPNCCN